MYGALDQLNRISLKEPVVIGDFNAKVGETTGVKGTPATGPFGLGERNERGERLIQFAIDNNLIIANTLFKHHPRRLSTWISPNQEHRNQIDYILIRRRWRSSIRNAKAKPGADCDSDHKLLMAIFRLRLKVRRVTFWPKRVDVGDPIVFRAKLGEKGIPQDDSLPANIDAAWRQVKDWIKSFADECRPGREPKRKHWLSDDTLMLVEERRSIRRRASDPDHAAQLQRLTREIKRLCRRDKNNFLQGICAESEQHSTNHDTYELFKTVKYLSRNFKVQTQIIQDEQENNQMDPESIAEV